MIHFVTKVLFAGLLLSLGFSSPSLAYDNSPDQGHRRSLFLQHELEGELVGRYLDLYSDDTAKLNFAEVKDLHSRGLFEASTTGVPGAGIEVGTIWAVLKIVNPSDRPRTLYLENRHPTDRLSLFRIMMDGTLSETKLGQREKSEKAEVDFFFPVFKVTLGPGENEVFFRLESLNPTYALFVWDASSFERHRLAEFAYNGALFGAMLLMILYNIFMFCTGRRQENILYVCYLLGFMIAELYLSGFGTYLLGKHRMPLVNHWPIALCMGTFGAILFAKRFLHADEYKTTWVFLRVVGAFFLIIPVMTFYSLPMSEFLLIPSVFLSFSLILYASVRRMKEGYRPAIFFTLSWVWMSLVGFSIVLTRMSILPLAPWTIRIGNIGVLVEMCLLSLALGEQIKQDRERYIQNLSQQNEKIQHAFRQMKKVFFPHQVELIEQGQDLESTMPTHRNEACVLCFDTIGSSKIQHEKTKEFLSGVFRRCNEIMAENYEGQELAANAFRIKEMGDGFLCSIGYPFRSRTGHMAMDALELAHRFAEAFHEQAKSLDYRDPLHCSIGIAMGTLSGFFPAVGTKQYDLYGRVITLATRYEGMRRVLMPADKPQSIIILQERVFLSLSQPQRQTFSEMDLAGAKLVVRDDPGALRLYYQKIS